MNTKQKQDNPKFRFSFGLLFWLFIGLGTTIFGTVLLYGVLQSRSQITKTEATVMGLESVRGDILGVRVSFMLNNERHKMTIRPHGDWLQWRTGDVRTIYVRQVGEHIRVEARDITSESLILFTVTSMIIGLGIIVILRNTVQKEIKKNIHCIAEKQKTYDTNRNNLRQRQRPAQNATRIRNL